MNHSTLWDENRGSTKAITLNDLSLYSGPQTPTIGTPFRLPSAVDVDSEAYMSELKKLLVRSRGSSYEATLKKFIDIKSKEILKSSASFSSPSRRSKSPATKPEPSPERVNISGLDDFMNNEPHDHGFTQRRLRHTMKQSHAASGQFKLPIEQVETPRQLDKQKWLDDLAQPLHRNIWKGRGDEQSVTTNHIGRQRPAAWDPPPRQVAAASTVVSLREFDKWLQRNNDWKASIREKIAKRSQAASEGEKAKASPRIDPKSAMLAQVAYKKYWESLQGQAAGASNDSISSSSKRGRSASPAPTTRRAASVEGRTSSPRRPAEDHQGSLTVFERLSIRSEWKHHARSSTPPPLSNAEFVFSPSISSHSRKLVAKRRIRASSAGSQRAADIGIVSASAQQHKLQESQHRKQQQSTGGSTGPERLGGRRSRSPSPSLDVTSEDIAQRHELSSHDVDDRSYERKFSLRSLQGGFSSGSLGGTATAAGGGGGGDLDGKSVSSTGRLRSPSRHSRGSSPVAKVKEWVSREEKALANSKPFQPHLLASETRRIMSRHHEDFNERVARSVENFHVRKAVAERAFVPGPMHYNLTASSTSSGQSPLKGSAHRCASPTGQHGFTWSRQEREVSRPSGSRHTGIAAYSTGHISSGSKVGVAPSTTGMAPVGSEATLGGSQQFSIGGSVLSGGTRESLNR